MAGIYIHIPFCKYKCNYCNFFSVASVKYRDVFIDALIKEVETRYNYLKGETVNTIYFGGGTPSLLNIDEINRIIDSLKSYFNINKTPEITLEANPDDLNFEKLFKLKNETSINRISIGVQSFNDENLIYLDRTHSAKDAYIALENVLKAGFNNITIDLIYGIPGLSEKKWKNNLDIFFSFNIPHLSSYSLTVEPKTALAYQINKKKRVEPDEEMSIKHFDILLNETEKHGFIHYEISNFAKEGFYSKHNSLYWLGGNYIGLGPSAHSFNGTSRQWNVASVKKYVEFEKVDKIIQEKEVLTNEQRFNEYVMTSLRTSYGTDIEHIENVFGVKLKDYFIKNVERFINESKVYKKGNRYILTTKGKLFADGIASELFIE